MIPAGAEHLQSLLNNKKRSELTARTRVAHGIGGRLNGNRV